MSKTHQKITEFLYSKTGIAISFALDFMMFAMPVFCIVSVKKRGGHFDPLLIFCIVFMFVIGTTGIITSVKRLRKFRAR